MLTASTRFIVHYVYTSFGTVSALSTNIYIIERKVLGLVTLISSS